MTAVGVGASHLLHNSSDRHPHTPPCPPQSTRLIIIIKRGPCSGRSQTCPKHLLPFWHRETTVCPSCPPSARIKPPTLLVVSLLCCCRPSTILFDARILHSSDWNHNIFGSSTRDPYRLFWRPASLLALLTIATLCDSTHAWHEHASTPASSSTSSASARA